jgi:ribosomal protein L37AE/L43A
MLTSPSQRQREVIQPYDGPSCPRCDWKLTADWIRTGIVRCPDCNREFEATAFNPPAKRLKVVEVAAVGPDGASACANHARNVATTSCTRCGLFICALCDMNLGSGSLCPACFDRARAAGALPSIATKTRDYYSMARVAAVVGMFFTMFFAGPLFGTLALFYQSKGRKERRARGDDPWTAGAIAVMLIAVLELGGGAIYDAIMIASIAGVFK